MPPKSKLRDPVMIGFRPVFLSFAASLVATTPHASPLPARAFERAEVFASCAGRFAALSTHQRAQQEADADTSRALSDAFSQMLEAVLPHALAQGVPMGQETRWRSAGWSEVAALLREKHPSIDQRRSDAAGRQLLRKMTSCRQLVLPLIERPSARPPQTTH